MNRIVIPGEENKKQDKDVKITVPGESEKKEEKKEPEERKGKHNWLEVRGQKFTSEEAIQAADFQDILDDYGMEPDDYVDFVGETQVKTGHQIVLAEKVPLDDLGAVLLGCDDERILEIAKQRVNKQNESEGGIIIDV